MKNAPDIGQLLLSRAYDPLSEPDEEIVVWRIQFQNIGSLGNFALVTGQPKAGKSRYLSAIMAAGLSLSEILGQQVRLPAGKRGIVHFDTEQSRHDYHRQMKFVKRLAGLENFPDWFNSYHCRQDGPAQIMAMIEYYLEINPMTGIAVLDGLLDMIDRFNDEGESKTLINFLKRITDKYGTLVIGVLHRSRSIDKTMGHVGAAADRAAQSVLKVDKTVEGPQVRYILSAEYLRSAETIEPITIFYNKAAEAWEICDNIPAEDQKQATNRKRRARELDISEHQWAVGQIFNSGTLLTYRQIIPKIIEAYGVGDTIAKQDYLPWLIREALIYNTGDGYTNKSQAKLFIQTA